MTDSTPMSGATTHVLATPAATTPAATTPAAVTPAPTLFVGIDVAKETLDLATATSAGSSPAISSAVLTVANDPAGIGAILKSLRAGPAVATAVIESTGGLERPILHALLDAGIPVALVNPGKVRHLAIGLGILAKTDHIDARVLAQFARLAAPRLARRQSANHRELDALITCRRQLTATRTEQGNRRHSTVSKAALKAIDAVLKTLDRQIEQLDAQIRKLIDSDDDFSSTDKLLQSVPGVGPVLSATLLAELAELGTTDRQHIGGLVGVVPYNRDSGKHSAKRSIRGGRTAVRSVLYMATVAAIRCNVVIKAFANRLRAKGKVGKVVVVACMRKLLTLLNAMIRDNLQWSQLTAVRNAAKTGGGAK